MNVLRLHFVFFLIKLENFFFSAFWDIFCRLFPIILAELVVVRKDHFCYFKRNKGIRRSGLFHSFDLMYLEVDLILSISLEWVQPPVLVVHLLRFNGRGRLLRDLFDRLLLFSHFHWNRILLKRQFIFKVLFVLFASNGSFLVLCLKTV